MAVQGIFNLKFLGPISFAILFLGALGFTQEAEATSFTATKDGDWDVGSTWVGGVAPPLTITSGDTVTIPSGITVTIPSSVTITVTSFGIVGITGKGTINNSGTIDNTGTIDITGFGTIKNSGTIDNTGTIDIFGFGNINNSGGTIDNFDTINNSGFIANSGGTINNSGTITVNSSGSLGRINNFGGTINNSGTITVNPGGFGGIIDNSGTIDNTGTINNFDTINNLGGGTIINNGDLKNSGTFNNNGLIINNSFLTNSGGVFNNFGQIDNTADGLIDNGFLAPSVSTFNNKPGGIINNDGDVYNDNGSTFNNDGTINNNVGAEIGNGGVGVNGGERSTFNNGGLIENDGLIFNDSTFNNSEGGIINNNDGGVFENFSLVTLANTETLNNRGTINNKEGGFIDTDFGLIDNFDSGLILNEGIISNKKGIIILNGIGDTIFNAGIIINQCNGLIDGDDPIDKGGVVHNRSCNGILYSIDSSNPPILREIDPTNAKTFSSVPISITGIDDEDIFGATGLATNPLTGELFAILKLDPDDDEAEDPEARTLVTVNPETGVATIIGSMGDAFAGIAFSSLGILFGVTGDGAVDDETLFFLSTSDGSATRLCKLGNGSSGEELAFNSDDGRLYHGSGSIFEKVDSSGTDPCTVTNVALSPGLFEVNALTYGADENLFFWAHLEGLFTITANPGVTTPVGVMDHSSKGLAFVPFEEPQPIAAVVTINGGGGPDEPPTIGKTTYGEQVVTCGVKFDGKCFTITAPFHEEFKLYEMMSGTHTISITMFCDNGVNTCNYAAIGIMPYSESMDNTTWKIELYKDFEGNLTIVKTDPEGFLGEVTVTTQIIDDTFWIVSFSVDFKNKDTGPMMFGVQARNDQNAVRNWYLNEGVEFKDSDAYPSIETEFEDSLEIDSLCLNEDSTYRYSCAFAEIRDRATQLAEETLRQMLNGEYTYK